MALRKHLLDTGWKEESADIQGISGNVMLTKANGFLTIVFADIGNEPAQISVLGIGVEPVKKPK